MLRTEVLAGASMKDGKMVREAYFALLDELFPESRASRKSFVDRSKTLLETEADKVYKVASPKLRRDIFERLDEFERASNEVKNRQARRQRK